MQKHQPNGALGNWTNAPKVLMLNATFWAVDSLEVRWPNGIEMTMVSRHELTWFVISYTIIAAAAPL